MSKEKILDDIKRTAKTIDTLLIAEEIVNWLSGNVENFVDNQMKVFRIDLVLDSQEGMLETQKLQRLYQSIPDSDLQDIKENKKIIEKCQECRKILDKITNDCFKNIKGNKELLKTLFERMIFFYEKVIPNPDSRTQAMVIDKKLKELVILKENASDKEKEKIQKQIVEIIKEGEQLVKFEKLEGFIDFVEFKYEAFEMNVSVKRGDDFNAEKKVIKDYNIPEGFTCCFELVYKIKQRPTGMF